MTLGNFTKEELDRTKALLEGLKATKFAINAPKHQCDNLQFHDVRRHFIEEVEEFNDVAYGKHSKEQLIELADIANCVDILAMLVLRQETLSRRENSVIEGIDSLFSEEGDKP